MPGKNANNLCKILGRCHTPPENQDSASSVPQYLTMCSCASQGKVLGLYEDWGVLFNCCQKKTDTCNLWISCKICENQRKRYTDMNAVNKHARTFHRNNQRSQKRARLCADMNGSVEMKIPPAGTSDNTSAVEQEMEEDISDGWINPMDIEEFNESPELNQHTMFARDVSPTLTWEECIDPYALGHISEASKSYFQYQHISETAHAGKEFLVKRAMAGKNLRPTEIQNISYPQTQIDLQMKTAHLAHNLTRGEYGKLAEIVHGFYNMGLEDGYETAAHQINEDTNKYIIQNQFRIEAELDVVRKKLTKPFESRELTKKAHAWSTVIPCSSADIRRLYLQGKYSIVNNLPTPAVFTELQDHAYLSIVDCIRDFLSHMGTESMEAITDETTKQSTNDTSINYCSQSVRAKEILRNAKRIKATESKDIIATRLDFWSDDHEVFSFGNSSIWTKTFTIGTLASKGQQMRATYPIAVGKKHADHDSVEKKFADELRLLQSGTLPPFYVGTIKKCINLHFELFATLQDQPERRFSNKLLGGNGKFSCRWGVSADHLTLYPRLKACGTCVMKMSKLYKNREFLSSPTCCTNCLNWDVLEDSPLAWVKPPKDYPTLAEMRNNNKVPFFANRCNKLIQIGDQELLKPFRQTYEEMKEALIVAQDCFLGGWWEKKHCVSFLKVHGANDYLIGQFIEHAVNVLAVKIADETNDEEILEKLRQQISVNPDLFQRCPTPVMWDREGVDLTTHIDAIMHLLFLGIVFSFMLKVQEWLTKQEKNSFFIRHNRGYLDPFVKSLHLDWLHVMPYNGGKFGGYVSKDYMAFSRLMKWFYQNIDESVAEVPDNQPQNGVPQKKWTKKHNKYWLDCRELDSSGDAAELRQRVAQFMLDPDSCPVPVPIPERKVEHIKDATIALHELLECVMKRTISPDDITKTEYAIRIFLSCYDTLDETVRPRHNSKPEVVSKFNFCCLLNLPDTMRKFGPLRNLWEGDFKGEGIIRLVKPLITQGHKLNWQQYLLQNIVREKAFTTIMDESKPTKSTLFSTHALRDRRPHFHKYESQLAVLRAVNYLFCRDKKVPVSVLLLADGASECCRLFAVAVDLESLVEIRLETNFTREKFGLQYYKFNADTTDVLNWSSDVVQGMNSARIGYAVLLPLLEREADEENRLFALVSSNWKSLSPTTRFSELFDAATEKVYTRNK